MLTQYMSQQRLLQQRLRAVTLLSVAPLAVAQAQSSPFMTGATALQTNILAWLTPIAIMLVMALGAMAMANRLQSQVAEGLRAKYRERVARRLERQLDREGPDGALGERPAAPSTAVAPVAGADVEEIRRRAREAWLQLRATEPQTNAQSLDRDQGREREARERDTAAAKSPQDDFAL